ncbi:MAG TPA: hypothetical protein VLH39_01880, partial [Magnetospirillaceae bacterium]|nr:hypothetical protein [Magnetospirillaceae bacterium]
MASRKKESPGKKAPAGKLKARRAPGRPDPGFLDRLSRAVEAEFQSSNGPTFPSQAQPDPNKRPVQFSPSDQAAEAGDAPPRQTPKKAKRAARTGGDRRLDLLDELTILLGELDEEGLDFLLEQAHVHRYNMEVERLTEAEERLASGRGLSRKAARKTGLGKPGATDRAPSLRI